VFICGRENFWPEYREVATNLNGRGGRGGIFFGNGKTKKSPIPITNAWGRLRGVEQRTTMIRIGLISRRSYCRGDHSRCSSAANTTSWSGRARSDRPVDVGVISIVLGRWRFPPLNHRHRGAHRDVLYRMVPLSSLRVGNVSLTVLSASWCFCLGCSERQCE